MSLEVVNMSDLSVPKIKEYEDKDFVTNGEKNSYFRTLIELYTSSATNNAVINEISRLVFGKGLGIESEDDETEYADESPLLDEINELIKPSDLKKFILDRIILGNAALQIVYKGIGNRKQVSEIKHFPVYTLAAQKIKWSDTKLKSDIQAYYYHPKWEKYEDRDKLKKLPAFGFGENIEIYVCKPYCPNMPYWSPVDYSGSLDYAKLECLVSEYLVNTVESGFAPTTIMNINKTTTSQDQREEFSRAIDKKFVGTHGAKLIKSFNDGEDKGITIDKIGTDDAASNLEYVAKEAARKILTGHRVTNPKLLGVPAEGEAGLGNNANEIEVAFDLFHNTVIQPFQDEILDGLKEILAINNIDAEFEFIRLEALREELYGEGQESLEEVSYDEYGEAQDNTEQEYGSDTY